MVDISTTMQYVQSVPAPRHVSCPVSWSTPLPQEWAHLPIIHPSMSPPIVRILHHQPQMLVQQQLYHNHQSSILQHYHQYQMDNSSSFYNQTHHHHLSRGGKLPNSLDVNTNQKQLEASLPLVLPQGTIKLTPQPREDNLTSGRSKIFKVSPESYSVSAKVKTIKEIRQCGDLQIALGSSQSCVQIFGLPDRHDTTGENSCVKSLERKKPRFDFANLPRFVSQENEAKSQNTERRVKIVSHAMQIVHTARSKKQFICKFCSREFTKSYNLLIHERTHTDERPFSCESCGKAFRRQDHLRDHRYIHSKEKPYRCDECGKGFCQARTLTVHKAVHLQQTTAPKVTTKRRRDKKLSTSTSSTSSSYSVSSSPTSSLQSSASSPSLSSPGMSVNDR